jgi:hypothetical protein
MLRHNTFAGATATVGAHENVKTPTFEQFQKSIETVNARMMDWEAQFQAFAVAHGCDLEAGAILVVPDVFDMRDVPPRYRAQVIQRGSDFGLLRNPTGECAMPAEPVAVELPTAEPAADEPPPEEPAPDAPTDTPTAE